MAISVLQTKFSDDAGVSGTTQTVAFTSNITAGSWIVLWTFTSGTVSTISDTLSNNYGSALATCLQAGRTLAIYAIASSSSSGANTVTVTWSAAQGGKSLAVAEIANCSAVQSAHAAQTQTNPGTGSDAISTGNQTPTSQPCLLLGLTAHFGGSAVTASAGTGFTDDGSGWFSPNRARMEDKRLTSTSAVAATFTNATDGGSATYQSASVVLTESTAAAPTVNPHFFGGGP